MADKEDVLIVYITVPDHELAITLARDLVSSRLVAGANVSGPVRSFYRWEEKVCDAEEWQIFAQTTVTAFARLNAWLASRHPHKVPCVVSLKISEGNAQFLAWIRENTEGAENCD